MKGFFYPVKFIVLSLSFYACAKQTSVPGQPIESSPVIARLGSKTTSQSNTSKTYILYQQKPEDGDHAARQYKYVVLRKSDNKLVLDGSYQLGYAKWISDTQIEVLSLPSIDAQDESKFKKVISVELPKL